jgi:hypothetical protein
MGSEQGSLGWKQGELSRDAELRMKSIIDEALKNGTAKPLQ